MGLDAYLYAVPSSKARETQIMQSLHSIGMEHSEVQELCSWRRHTGLHSWMARLFRRKGGVITDEFIEDGFNQHYVRLLDDDLTLLAADISSGKIQDTSMLFNNAYTLGYCIPSARDAIAAGSAVFYFGLY